MKMEKRKFRIGQLADKLGVERFVIRFWEKEFGIKSTRSTGGQRFYDETDLSRFQAIKELLYDKGFTIAGAKKILRFTAAPVASLSSEASVSVLDSTTIRPAELVIPGSSRSNSGALPPNVTEQLLDLHQQLVKLRELL